MTPKRPAADSNSEPKSASKPLRPKPKREPDSDSSSQSPDDDDSPPKKKSRKQARPRPTKTDGSQMHRRSREGCYTCRVRRKKCDEALPVGTRVRGTTGRKLISVQDLRCMLKPASKV